MAERDAPLVTKLNVKCIAFFSKKLYNLNKNNECKVIKMKKEMYDLTNPQKSIWMTEQFFDNTNINNIVGYLRIEKNVDFKALEKAVNFFIMKNDSFKTKITLENGSCKQYFEDFVYEELEIIDLKDESQLLEFEVSFPKKTIDVLDNFLYLIKLLRFPNGSGIFVITAHHLIADAWTMTLVLEQVYENYLHIMNGEEIDLMPNPSYEEFIKSQNKYMICDKFKRDQEFWQDNFKVLPNIVSFKNNQKVSIQAERKIYTFDKALVSQMGEFCKKYNISEYIFLFSIFNIYFRNIFNCENFIIGNPVLNRSNFKEKQMTGMFVSIMPFIVDFSKSKTFIDFCQLVASKQKQMYRHIRFPYHEILNFVRKTHDFSDGLYDIIFSYQNATIPSYGKWLPNRSQAESLQIHIKNIAEEKNNLSIHYDYLIDIFSEEAIDLMHKRILNMMQQIFKQPDKIIEEIEIIAASEKKLLLKTFNDTKTKYNKTSNIIKEFEKIVEQYPKNIAVMDKDTSLTYEELNRRSNFLAKQIIEQKISTDIIAFSLNRSASIIITILAILKSGHTYMPIDPEYPVERINFMLENSNTKVLITTQEFHQKINYKETCIYYEELAFDDKIENLKIAIPNDKPCYIMYTSGSTGIPKAVTIKHYNVLNFVKSMQERLNYKVFPDNKVLSVTTVCFDIFVFELFPSLLSGITLVIADELESKSPKLLSSMIQKYQITKILTTPSRIELLFSDPTSLNSVTSIKEFILGGEPLPIKLLEKLQKHTKARIFNLYGPTETTVYSTFKEVTNVSNQITIGKPIDNTQIYILNDNNHLQPIGLVGEICIGGDGVGCGYYKNEEKTKLAFIKNPYGEDTIYKTGDLGYFQQNGELVCLGRKDHQVKLRGYRVELDDISNNILTFGGIEKCVVIDKTDSDGKKYLCAYLVAKQKIDKVALKKYLVDILPHYMIPNYFLEIDKIPLTLNHKVDRKALPEPDLEEIASLEEYVKPTTKIEKDLCAIFKTCLNISKIGIENDIFDYHMDSLDIIRIQTKMLEYQYRLNTQDFYQGRTIKNIASIIEEKGTKKEEQIDEKYLSNVSNSFYKHPSIMNFEKKPYKNILLLGCTGFLGIHILQEVLNNSNAHITCIIRSKEDDAKKRLANLYRFYFNKKLPLERIEIIESDITKAHLGLPATQYKQLATAIDFVVNSAANVKYYGDYKQFKKINVDVVQNLIDFSMKYDIPLVHISTLGVSGNYLVNHQKNYNDFDENDFYIGQQFCENVYIQTKFEAETLIYEKVQEGLKASIFRVGNLTSRYSDRRISTKF